MKKPLLTILAIALAFAATAQERPNVLFIGNSYTEVNNLPQMVADVALSMGDEMTYSSNTPGGCTFQQHCTNQSMEMIRHGGWDVVVLQEQSQYPSFPQSQVEAEVFPYAERLVDSIYAHNPCAEPMFYMTWGRRDGDQQNAQYFPVLGTYEGMDSMLCLRYTYMADTNDASLCPVGRVWRHLRRNNPDIELYASDGSHPSVAGTYAAACSFYTLIFHRNPTDITFVPEGLDTATATVIRSAVHDIVYDRLPQWQRPLPYADLAISYGAEPLSFWFAASDPQHADSLYLDFGDGNDTLFASSDETIFVIHTYPDSGNYTIVYTAMRHCMTDTILVLEDWHVAPPPDEPEGITSAANGRNLSVYPNPVSGVLTVGVDGTATASLYAADGRMVWRGTVDGNTAIPLHGLAAGCYTLRVGNAVTKVMVR